MGNPGRRYACRRCVTGSASPRSIHRRQDGETISVDETAHRLKISVGSVQRLIRQGILPATQLMPSAPWKVPVAALDTEAVQIGVQGVIARRPRNFVDLKDKRL